MRIGSCPVRALVLARLNLWDLLQEIWLITDSKIYSLLSRPTNAQNIFVIYIFIYVQCFIYNKYSFMFRCICIIFR